MFLFSEFLSSYTCQNNMGNSQDRQSSSSTIAQELTAKVVVKDQTWKYELNAALENLNADPSLNLLRWNMGVDRSIDCLYDVKSVRLGLETDQQRSEIELLGYLSKTFCQKLARKGVSCWFSLASRSGGGNQRPAVCHLGVFSIAFGTLESATSFVTNCAGIVPVQDLEFLFHGKKIRLTQKSGEKLFRLEMDFRTMHRILHVVRRENRSDIYFQLRQPPFIFECLNVDDLEEKWLFSRRSYLPDVPSEEIGQCDVLRISSTGCTDGDLLEILSNLAADNSLWDFRFTWIGERKVNVPAVDETKLTSFDVLYAVKVLESVGLRCQLINWEVLLGSQPENARAEVLYSIAERYANTGEYYLIDVNEVIKKRLPRQPAKDCTRIRVAVLTPTRLIFQRPSDYESNRVFREYFAENRAEYAMKVHFRDEDVQGDQKNLHHIHLLQWKGALDDEVRYFQFSRSRENLTVLIMFGHATLDHAH